MLPPANWRSSARSAAMSFAPAAIASFFIAS
jgi:hypothetical protein